MLEVLINAGQKIKKGDEVLHSYLLIWYKNNNQTIVLLVTN